jgi:hypothetical protein
MVARKNATISRLAEASREQKPVKRKAPLGTDLALTLPTAKGTSLVLSYWDLWFVLAAVKVFGGDLECLTSDLKREYYLIFDMMSSTDFLSAERKGNHVRDLKRRMEEASATPTQIVTAAGDLARAEDRRALRKARDGYVREREWSLPMRDTPRKRRSDHALRSFWPRFPVSLEPYAKAIGTHFKTRRSFEVISLDVARTLGRYLDQSDKLSKSGKYAESQALLRAWTTVVIELVQVKTHWNGLAAEFHRGQAMMKCGLIWKSLSEGLAAYLKIPLDKTGIDEAVFFPDLLDFLIWERYWLTHFRIEVHFKGLIEVYFKGLNEGRACLCIKHLRHEVAALLEDELEDKRQEALTLLGQVIAEQERFDEFEDVARQMGTWHSNRIVRLVDVAMKRRKKRLAIKVLGAALMQGEYWGSPKFLKEKYEKLKQGHWSPDPRK